MRDYIDSLRDEALMVAKDAGAVVECLHGTALRRGGDDITALAYAKASLRWDKGDLGCARQQFLDALKTVLEHTASYCPSCVKPSGD